MNCEFWGYRSWKLSEDESLNGTSRIRRASMLLGSGVAPKGMIVARYGGLPEPVMLKERSWHCRGVLVKSNENAAAPGASSATGSTAAVRASSEVGSVGMAGAEEWAGGG